MRFAQNDLQPFVQDMMALGFSDYEARSYIVLARGEALTVYEISKLTGMPRPNLYNAVERLIHREAVQAVGKRPARYTAVQPEVLFERIVRTTAARCKELTSKLTAPEVKSNKQFAYSVSGTAQVIKKLDELIRAANRTIWLKATDNFIVANHAALQAAASRGVKIVIVFFGQLPPKLRFRRNVAIYPHDNNGIRLGIADQQFSIVRDSQEAFIANVIGDNYGIHTESAPVVRVTELLLRKDVYLVEILKKFGPQIEQEYGPLLAGLRRKFLTGDELKKFNAAFAKHGLGAHQ